MTGAEVQCTDPLTTTGFALEGSGTIMCFPAQSARYVFLRAGSANGINITEIRVYGTPNLIPTTFIYSASGHWGDWTA